MNNSRSLSPDESISLPGERLLLVPSLCEKVVSVITWTNSSRRSVEKRIQDKQGAE